MVSPEPSRSTSLRTSSAIASTAGHEVKDQIQLKGFRRGKVPVPHIKKLFGRSLMAEVVQRTLEETSAKVIADRKERPAFQPKIDVTENKDEIEQVMSGASDFQYTVSFEVLPEIQ